MQGNKVNQGNFSLFERRSFSLQSLKLSITYFFRSSHYSEITDRSRKMTIFGKSAINPDEGPYRKN